MRMGRNRQGLPLIKHRRPSLLLPRLMHIEDGLMGTLSTPSCTIRSVLISDQNDDDVLRVGLENLLMISLCSVTRMGISSEGLLGHDVVEVFP